MTSEERLAEIRYVAGRSEAAEKRAEAAERTCERFDRIAQEQRERAEDAERKLAALTAISRRAVAWAEQDDPEVWVACDKLGEALADVAPVAERHDREVRAKELRRMAEQALAADNDCPFYGDEAHDLNGWLRDEADRIERGEA